MPAQGVPNNPSGANNWQGFGTEEPYGQGTKNQQLKQGAPLAGAPVSSGPIAAPKRAGRKAKRGAPAAPQQAPPPVAMQPAQAPSYDARLAVYWQGIAAIPGASPLVKQYAAIAIQRLLPNGNLVNAAWGDHSGSGATVGGKAGQGQSGLPPLTPPKA